MAHRRAYKLIADQKQDGYYIVTEDDVTFKSDWLSKWEQAVDNMPDNTWPMVCETPLSSPYSTLLLIESRPSDPLLISAII